MRDYTDLIGPANQAVGMAADLVRQIGPGAIKIKAYRDFVTEADLAVERVVREFLGQATPQIDFLGEEEGYTRRGEENLTWVLDPIDGTVNFIHGIPVCGVSLALTHNKRPVLGVIDLPFLGERHHAITGLGAYLNGKRIQIRDTPLLGKAIVAAGECEIGNDPDQASRVWTSVIRRLAAEALRVRMLGSAAVELAWLADGRIDASITLSNNPWDMAAGVVIAREAGARVTDGEGREHSHESLVTIAAHPKLISTLVTIVHDATQEASATRAEGNKGI